MLVLNHATPDSLPSNSALVHLPSNFALVHSVTEERLLLTVQTQDWSLVSHEPVSWAAL